MAVSMTLWVITGVAVALVFIADFYGHVRTPHVPGFRESGVWTAVYVVAAIVFGFVVWSVWGAGYGGEFFAGYVTEKALSVDNLFVFVVILARFKVPREYQQKVLLLGIAIALVLRGVSIAVGAAAINAYSWVFYLFGVFLLYTAVKLAIESRSGTDGRVQAGGDAGPAYGDAPVDGPCAQEPDSGEAGDESGVMRAVRRLLPTTRAYDGDRLITRVDGRLLATPLLAVVVVLGVTDVLFALDSIPAIFGLTREPYLVFMANAFALMGLRQMYFLLEGLLDRLVYLAYGLAVILGFIGVKLILHALGENSVPFVAHGRPIDVPEVSTVASLVVIAVVLFLATVASLARSRGAARRG